jgi:hypothetical protein
MPKATRLRQEVLNTILADLICDRGINATPENVVLKEGKHLPDVRAVYLGVRVVIECEVGTVGAAGNKALESAKGRVDDGIADVGVALVYSIELATQPDVASVRALMLSPTAAFHIAVVTEAAQEPFSSGNLDYLMDVLHQAWRRLLTEDLLSRTVQELDEAVGEFAQVVSGHTGITKKLAKTLGIQGQPDKRVEADHE